MLISCSVNSRLYFARFATENVVRSCQNASPTADPFCNAPFMCGRSLCPFCDIRLPGNAQKRFRRSDFEVSQITLTCQTSSAWTHCNITNSSLIRFVVMKFRTSLLASHRQKYFSLPVHVVDICIGFNLSKNAAVKTMLCTVSTLHALPESGMCLFPILLLDPFEELSSSS